MRFGERHHHQFFSYKRDFVDWIEEAKKQETRVARLEKSIALLVAGKRAPS